MADGLHFVKLPGKMSQTPDPSRLIALLWNVNPPAAPRGRPSRLGARQIIITAVRMADIEGLGGLTMRSLAQSLQSSPMALYNHVPTRDDLLVLMLDHCYGEMRRRDTTGMPWRERLEAIARDHWDLILDHPWIVEMPSTRPPLGPGQVGKYEYDLAAFEGLIMSDVELDQTLASLLDLASGSARQKIAAQREQERSGMQDAEWWATNGPHFAAAFHTSRFPLATRVGQASASASGAAYDPRAAFERGLSLMLDGLSARNP